MFGNKLVQSIRGYGRPESKTGLQHRKTITNNDNFYDSRINYSTGGKMTLDKKELINDILSIVETNIIRINHNIEKLDNKIASAPLNDSAIEYYKTYKKLEQADLDKHKEVLKGVITL